MNKSKIALISISKIYIYIYIYIHTYVERDRETFIEGYFDSLIVWDRERDSLVNTETEKDINIDRYR